MGAGVIVTIVSIAVTFGVVVAALFLGAYKAYLAAQLDAAEIGEADTAAALHRIQALEAEVERLTERADFTDKLLGSGPRNQDDRDQYRASS